MKNQEPIKKSIIVLKNNIKRISTVAEWARMMKFKSSKYFSRCFFKRYRIRPQQVLILLRLKNIIEELRNSENSNYEIAWNHNMSDEKTLNSFLNYHLKVSPTKIREMEEKKLQSRMEKLWSNNEEYYSLMKHFDNNMNSD